MEKGDGMGYHGKYKQKYQLRRASQSISASDICYVNGFPVLKVKIPDIYANFIDDYSPLIVINRNTDYIERFDFQRFQTTCYPKDFNPKEYNGFTDMELCPDGVDYYPNQAVMILTEAEK